MSHKSDYDGKGDRALVLFEQQHLSRSEIAERLGVKPVNVAGMLQRARERRAASQEGAGA
jgi:DNA-binding transcriptional regulator LsrR (DeoR family)